MILRVEKGFDSRRGHHQRTQILIQNQCLRSFIFSGFMGIYCEKPPIFEILAVLGLFVSDYHPERAGFFYAFN